MPRRKKDPSVRARRNVASTSATLHRVDENTTATEGYGKLTVAQLKLEIDRRNDDGRTTALSKKGAKGALVAILLADDSPVPALPDHPLGVWHARTADWWNDVWSSPMSNEWDRSDIHNLYLLALLYNDMWCAESAKARKEAATEFRLQRADLGLSPYSRRRLEWTIETAAEAQDKGQQRRTRRSTVPPAGAQGAPPAAGAPAAADPRRVLEAVK